MLVLSRKEGEAIVIDGNIRVVVLSCDRRGVRLGIEAPTETGILREELVVQVASENQRARASNDASAWAARVPLRSTRSDRPG
ncbi:MAG: carbon storage regulator CsrA [Gemmatimonadales bacterium]